MAAAVADFKPASSSIQKIKREAGPPRLELAPTPDILAAVAEHKATTGYPKVTVGFAAESQKVIESAEAKLRSKRVDIMVANDITAQDAGFGADTNRVSLLDSTGGVESLPLMSKYEVAEAVLERVLAILREQGR